MSGVLAMLNFYHTLVADKMARHACFSNVAIAPTFEGFSGSINR